MNGVRERSDGTWQGLVVQLVDDNDEVEDEDRTRWRQAKY